MFACFHSLFKHLLLENAIFMFFKSLFIDLNVVCSGFIFINAPKCNQLEVYIYMFVFTMKEISNEQKSWGQQ